MRVVQRGGRAAGVGVPKVHASLVRLGPIVGGVTTLLSTTFLPGKASLQPHLERRRDNRRRGLDAE